jgi:hypothetical protein
VWIRKLLWTSKGANYRASIYWDRYQPVIRAWWRPCRSRGQVSRSDQGLVAAIFFVLFVLAAIGGLGTWIGHVQTECRQSVRD